MSAKTSDDTWQAPGLGHNLDWVVAFCWLLLCLNGIAFGAGCFLRETTLVIAGLGGMLVCGIAAAVLSTLIRIEHKLDVLNAKPKP